MQVQECNSHLDYNGKRFLPFPRNPASAIQPPEEVLGFFKQRHNGFQLFDREGALQAFLVQSARQGHFVVSASNTKDGARYMFSTSTLTERWLGIDEISYSQATEAARSACLKDDSKDIVQPSA